MGLLGNIFKKKARLLEPADISLLKTDLHSHLVPGIDDGAQSMEETMELIHRLHAFGYRKLITTPHVMGDTYRNTPEIILSGLADIKVAIEKAGLDMEIEASAEYYLDDSFGALIESDNLLPFGGDKRYILFELPFVGEPLNLSRVIFNLQLKGYKPILAHPERYGFWFKTPEKLTELADKGVLLQLNLNSLSGYYGPEAKKTSEWLIAQGLVSFLGTDCHRMDHLNTYADITCRTPAFHQLLAGNTLLNTKL